MPTNTWTFSISWSLCGFFFSKLKNRRYWIWWRLIRSWHIRTLHCLVSSGVSARVSGHLLVADTVLKDKTSILVSLMCALLWSASGRRGYDRHHERWGCTWVHRRPANVIAVSCWRGAIVSSVRRQFRIVWRERKIQQTETHCLFSRGCRRIAGGGRIGRRLAVL